MAFEEQFDLKVQEVDEKYKKRINELMMQNTELKLVETMIEKHTDIIQSFIHFYLFFIY